MACNYKLLILIVDTMWRRTYPDLVRQTVILDLKLLVVPGHCTTRAEVSINVEPSNLILQRIPQFLSRLTQKHSNEHVTSTYEHVTSMYERVISMYEHVTSM